MTAREHLQRLHKASAGHHRLLSKCHAEALAKQTMGTTEHEFHKSAQAAHDGAAESHDAMCLECEKADTGYLEKSLSSIPALNAYIAKAVADAIGNTVVPTGISAIAPEAPRRPGYVAIPRAGQPNLTPAAPAVPLEFQKLFDVNGSESLSQ